MILRGVHGFQRVSEGGINRRQQNVKGGIRGGGGKNIAEPTPYTLPPTPYPQATNNDRS